MMLYSCCDTLSQDFSPPFVASSDAVASRSFTIFLNGLNPFEAKDFRLYKIGEFNPKVGTIRSFSVFEEVDFVPLREVVKEVVNE